MAVETRKHAMSQSFLHVVIRSLTEPLSMFTRSKERVYLTSHASLLTGKNASWRQRQAPCAAPCGSVLAGNGNIVQPETANKTDQKFQLKSCRMSHNLNTFGDDLDLE